MVNRLHLWKPFDFLPGHGTSLLQSSTSLEYPAHFFPPYCAAGESHFRALEYFPCLQVLLQVLHGLQLPHIPSTKEGEVEVILKLRCYFLFISLIVSGRYPENPAIWLVPGAGSISLSSLTTVMVTNYAKRRVKLRIERAKFQNRTKTKTKQKQKHWQKQKKTNDDKNMTFPIFLNSFSYLLKIEFRNK